MAQEACQLCEQGLRLHKFVYNGKAVLKSIPPSEGAVDVKAVGKRNFRFCVNLISTGLLHKSPE